MITKSEIRISTRLIGQRFTPAFPDEIILTNGEKFIWQNMNYQVRLNDSQQVLKVHSSQFSRDAELTFNGRRWHGFTNIPGRKLPIEVEVW